MTRKAYIIFFLLFLKSLGHGQEQVITINQELFDVQDRIQLADLDGWIFYNGNTHGAASMDMDQSAWQSLNPGELYTIEPDSQGRLEAWFRIKLRLETDMEGIPLYLSRDLWAATEIYLDEELIHSFGSTGSTKSDFQYYNPHHNDPIAIDMGTNREYLLAVHFANYEGLYTPREIRLSDDNLSNLLNLVGPEFMQRRGEFQKSAYIHSTIWVCLSTIFMILFWLMYAQNPEEKVFFLIAILSTTNLLTITGNSLNIFFNLSYTQEIVNFFIWATSGAITNGLMLMTAEWIFNKKNTKLSKFLLITLPAASLIAHLYDISAPFGILNSILTGYFVYLIIVNWNRATRVQWAAVVAMFIFLVSISLYLVLAKLSIEFFDAYGNLLLSIALFIPLITLLIYVAMRFREIIQERVNLQIEKTAQLEAINVASAKFVPSTFLNFLGKKNILDASLGDYVERQVTVLFSDIRDYSTLSEKMTPEENFRFVNEFNQRMGPIIQKHNGFINQYLGDGIMAIFPENPEDTLKAAIAMQEELHNYNQERNRKNRIPIRMGIGLHSGPLIMGIIGDDQRMDAATISDTVNTSSRIEGLTKYFGVNILLSEGCLNKLESKEKYSLRFLGSVQVKGREKAVKIYECLNGESVDQKNLKVETLEEFHNGLKAYLHQDFKSAHTIFLQILERNPLDKTVTLFLNKAKKLEDNGVTKDWTGVEKVTQK